MLFNFIIVIVILCTLYLLAIMPKLKPNPIAKSLKGWFYAHRGFHNNQSDAPENSIRAFQLAVEMQYGIELDVQITKDLVPVVFHDYNILRACGVDCKVSTLTLKELKKYYLFGTQEQIPTLNETLACINGRVPIIIELKIPWEAKKLCEIISLILRDYSGVYCIESFNPFGLYWYRKHDPKVVRGQLSTDFAKEKIEGSKVQYFILKHLLMNFQTKPDFIAYQDTYRKGLSFTLCRKLYRTKAVAWTIKSQEELEIARKYYELFIFEGFTPKVSE